MAIVKDFVFAEELALAVIKASDRVKSADVYHEIEQLDQGICGQKTRKQTTEKRPKTDGKTNRGFNPTNFSAVNFRPGSPHQVFT